MIRLGRYLVRIGLRRDNPAFPVYLIYRGDKLIGRSFSMPDLGCCEYLERQELDRISYARESAQQRKAKLRGVCAIRKRRAA